MPVVQKELKVLELVMDETQQPWHLAGSTSAFLHGNKVARKIVQICTGVDDYDPAVNMKHQELYELVDDVMMSSWGTSDAADKAAMTFANRTVKKIMELFQ